MKNSSKTNIVIALAGNPNSGKTTVFNELTGSHQHVGNWPGVTVEHKEGTLRRDGHEFRVIDLPGIYSLSAYSQEEIIARDFLLNEPIDVIVNIVDASNLERNLYLTTQLLELGLPVVVALNMIDVAEGMGQRLDLDKLAGLMGVEIVPTVAAKGEGMREILDTVLKLAETGYEAPRSTRHNPEVEIEVSKLLDELPIIVNDEGRCAGSMPARWLVIKTLEGDSVARQKLAECSTDPQDTLNKVDETKRHLAEGFGDDPETVIADGRYGFIGGLLREVVTRTPSVDRIATSDRIDDVLLHRWLGIPIFLGLMWLTFKLTFDVGGVFTEWIEIGISAFGAWLEALLPAGPLSSLIIDGVIAGVGGVVVFVPNIAIIFLIISFLEDSGYMARAAFLMDRSMHVIGLHGKSFIPMLMGFGCNVPAVMATRTLETREDRLLTILINPLMSCAARLPIYILFTGIFFSAHGAMVIFSIYVLGVLLAVLSGKLFRKVLFPKAASPFVMELPPYRMPTLKGTLHHVWERTWLFLSKAGTVILAASIVIWALGSLPWGVEFSSSESLVGYLGRAIEPVVKPLGLDWRAAVALLFGIGAKEIVVSTLGVLYGGSHPSGDLNTALSESFTSLTAYTFMVVSLIYVPCIATVAAIKRETNSWKWTMFSVGYSIGLAYLVGFIVYRLGLLIGMI
ncbi:MAG: ferrous iron transport protein B [Armatimonadetes bacterium]|jgi:ferrous iron transport protein B|nr:ferrous iron transport protein B [Armatimonadota bacterium]